MGGGSSTLICLLLNLAPEAAAAPARRHRPARLATTRPNTSDALNGTAALMSAKQLEIMATPFRSVITVQLSMAHQ
jgi:hypothetical protein